MGDYTAAQAYDLLNYLNNTRGKRIKYVTIGNEPDQYPGYPSGGTAQAKSDYIAAYFRPFAETLKVATSSVKIIGSSFATYDAGAFGKLLDVSNSTGNIVLTDVYGRYWLDIVDVHYYPFSGSQTLPNVQSNPASMSSGGLKYNLTDMTNGLVPKISTANGSRTSSPLQFSVSEINIDYANPSSNTYSDRGANGFIAGQWLAECYSVILSAGKNSSSANSLVAFVAPWSIHESGGDATNPYDLSLINGNSPCTTNVERSTYHHIALLAKYFSNGTYYAGTAKNSGGTDIPNVKVFGSYLANGFYAIMILNEEASTSYATYSVNTGSTTPTTSALNSAMNMPGTNRNYTYSSGIAAKATHLIILDCSGNLVKRIVYTETDAQTYATPSETAGGGSPVSPIFLDISAVNTGCTSSTSSGSATTSASGGTGTITYSWAPTGYTGGSTSAYSALPAGEYTVTVSGATCTANYKNTITVSKDSPKIGISSPSHANSCSSTATFTSTVSGGTSPYTYSWSGGLGTSSVSGTSTRPSTANTSATYTLTVTDNKGCVNTATASHYALHAVSISGPSTVGGCCGLTLTATYIPGATYSWKRNGTLVTGANSYQLIYPGGSGGPGTYSVTATSANSDSDPCAAVSNTYTVSPLGADCECTPPDGSPKMAGPNTVSVNEVSASSSIQTLAPNPAQNQVSVYYTIAEENSVAELLITTVYGQQIQHLLADPKKEKLDINCAYLENGVYFTTLLVNGKPVSTRRLVIAK